MKRALVLALVALAGCDNNSLVTVTKPPAVVVGELQPHGGAVELRTQAVSITPITSTGAGSSGMAFSGDRFDVTCALSGGAVVLTAAAHDGTAWHVWQGNPCNLDSTMAARGSCSFPARRDTGLTWNVFKTGAGAASSCTATGAYGPVVRNASGTSGALTNVTVSSPLSGDGTSGSPVTLGTVPASTGGTGQSTYAVGDLLVGAAGNTLSKLAIGASGRVLASNGTTTAWTARGVLTLGTGLSGTSYNGASDVTAAVSYGSTSGTATQGNDSRLLPAPSGAGKLPYDNGSAYAVLVAGTAGQLLRSGGAGAPSWVQPALFSYPVNSASGITYTASSTTPLYYSHPGAASYGANCTPLYATIGTGPNKIVAVRMSITNSLTGAGSIRYGLYDCDAAAYVSGASVDYVVGSAALVSLTPSTTLTADHSYGFQIVGLAAGGTARLNYLNLQFE